MDKKDNIVRLPMTDTNKLTVEDLMKAMVKLDYAEAACRAVSFIEENGTGEILRHISSLADISVQMITEANEIINRYWMENS